MKTGYDIAVIGGGVIGLSLARALLAEGARVAVIDAGADIPAATNAAAGMLAPSFETGHGPGGGLGEALYAFGAASLALWPDYAAALEEESGGFVDYRDDGILGAALDDARADELVRHAAALRVRGASVEVLDGAEARRLEPALSEGIVAALYAPQDAQVDPRLLLAALKTAFEKAGGVWLASRVLRAFECAGRIALSLDGDPSGLEADRIALASGAAAGALFDNLPPPPVAPVKGEAIALKTEGAFLRRVVRAPGAYLCPKAAGRLIIGATEYEGVADLDVNAAAAEGLKRNGARAAPAVASFAEIERWAGLRPGTPDGAPILGRSERGAERVFFALGHYRNGVLLAPASAAALCDLILDRKSEYDLSPFGADRFDAD